MSAQGGKRLALIGVLLLVVADVAVTGMSLAVGFTPALIAPTLVAVLLAVLAYRRIGWARWLLVALAVLRLVVISGWLIDAAWARSLVGVVVTLAFASAYGIAVYVLAISRTGRAYYAWGEAERIG